MLIYAGDLVIGPSGVPRKVSVKPSAVAVPPPQICGYCLSSDSDSGFFPVVLPLSSVVTVAVLPVAIG